MIPEKTLNQNRFIKYILLFFTAVFLLTLIILQYVIIQEKKLANQIYPHVFVNDIGVGRKNKEEASVIFSEKNKILRNVSLTVTYKEDVIATLSAEQLNIHSNGEEIIERAYLIGRSSHMPSRIYQKITTLFNLSQYKFNSQIDYDKDSLSELLSNAEDRYNAPAKNALFSFESGKVVSFRADKKGLKIDSKKLLSDAETAIRSLDKKVQNIKIALTSIQIEPEISLKNSNQFGIEEQIGEGKSNYSHSIPERIHNVILASSKFHGILIPRNKVFSFNDTIGDISSITGYKPAYIIKNGKTVLGDGGGVCQVSTTLFRAALNTGLPIVERTPHAYRVSYYENGSRPGLDATVFSPSVDLKFKNDTQAAILIMVETDKENNTLTIKFYGKKDERSVELSDVTVYDEESPPPPLYQDEPTLKRGVTRQVDFPAWGAKTYFTYKVTKENNILFEKKFFSSFRPWQAVYLVGTAQ